MDELYTVLALSGWRPLENIYNDIPAFAIVNASSGYMMYRHPVKFSIVVRPSKDVLLARFRGADWKDVPRAFLEQCSEVIDGS